MPIGDGIVLDHLDCTTDSPSSNTVPLQQGRLFMQAPSKPGSPPVHEDKQPPVATFKTSLRDWQARYKARRAAQAPIRGKAYNQTTPA
jgi:hypothetical protein